MNPPARSTLTLARPLHSAEREVAARQADAKVRARAAVCNMWSMSLLLPVLAALGAHAKSKGASVPQRLRADVGQWLRSARPGYCANTGWGLEAKSLCRSGEKGVLPLNRRAFLSWPDAVASCMKLCRTCANCNFITVSLSFKDCSWYRSCNRPENDIKGFRSAPVNRTRTRRRRTFRLPAHVLATRDRRAVPNEVALRYGELLNYSQGSYNLTGVSALMQHPRLASTIHRGIHLAPSGRRWTPKELETYAESVYAKHNAQTATQRTALRQKWRAPIVGATKVWDLVQLLHFTIDHTDVALMYTSQLIHCLQVCVGRPRSRRHPALTVREVRNATRKRSTRVRVATSTLPACAWRPAPHGQHLASTRVATCRTPRSSSPSPPFRGTAPSGSRMTPPTRRTCASRPSCTTWASCSPCSESATTTWTA